MSKYLLGQGLDLNRCHVINLVKRIKLSSEHNDPYTLRINPLIKSITHLVLLGSFRAIAACSFCGDRIEIIN